MISGSSLRAAALGGIAGIMLCANILWPQVIQTQVETVEVIRTVQTTIEVEIPVLENTPFNQRDHMLLAATMWGEARGEGAEAMRAVGHVVMNRYHNENSARYGTNLRGVILRPWQFSAWNHGDPNRDRMLRLVAGWRPPGADGDAWLMARALARDIMTGRSTDPTGGALYYHTQEVNPSWNRSGEVSTVLGSHIFYASLRD